MLRCAQDDCPNGTGLYFQNGSGISFAIGLAERTSSKMDQGLALRLDGLAAVRLLREACGLEGKLLWLWIFCL